MFSEISTKWSLDKISGNKIIIIAIFATDIIIKIWRIWDYIFLEKFCWNFLFGLGLDFELGGNNIAWKVEWKERWISNSVSIHIKLVVSNPNYSQTIYQNFWRVWIKQKPCFTNKYLLIIYRIPTQPFKNTFQTFMVYFSCSPNHR